MDKIQYNCKCFSVNSVRLFDSFLVFTLNELSVWVIKFKNRYAICKHWIQKTINDFFCFVILKSVVFELIVAKCIPIYKDTSYFQTSMTSRHSTV